jgi:hypothetical protein
MAAPATIKSFNNGTHDLMIAVERYESHFRLKSEWIPLGKLDRWFVSIGNNLSYQQLLV